MENINLFLVFLEGMLSLFSPCILPVIPIYLGMLSGSSIDSLKYGEDRFINNKLLLNTILFVLGISTTFFILGSSAGLLNYFLVSHKNTIIITGGLLIIFMGIFYMGYINIPFLQKEKRINIEVKEMKPYTSYFLGFAFSFGWTPCIGPMLSSILIMTSASNTILTGNILIFIYTLGFTVPFIIIAAFYNKLYSYLDKLKLHLDIIKKIGGGVLIISGLVMILSNTDIVSSIKKAVSYPIKSIQNENKGASEETKTKAPDFTLKDQYGKTHKLSDYKGKIVFLNFWATWCPPCRGELPDIENIFMEYSSDDVIILGITAPNLGNEGSENDIKNFLSENGYTFPAAFDSTGDVMNQYDIRAFPTTFIISKEGYIYKKVVGAMDKGKIKSLIDNAD